MHPQVLQCSLQEEAVLLGDILHQLYCLKGIKFPIFQEMNGISGKVRVFRWDPEKEICMTPEYLRGGLFNSSCRSKYRRKTMDKKKKRGNCHSRVATARLLHRIISENRIPLKAFITASATGYYGSITSERIFTEEDPPAEDFLGTTCRLWEEGADLFEDLGIRTVKIRTAVVLEKSDSALSKLMKPAKFGLVVRLGNGKQYFPWIHINDLCNIYLKALKDQNMSGAYNAVAPEHINHNDFVRTMAGVMNKPVFLPPVPAWYIKN